MRQGLIHQIFGRGEGVSHPVVAVDAVHSLGLALCDLFCRERIGYVVIYDGPPVGQRRAYPRDIQLVLIDGDVLDRVGDMPVNVKAFTLSHLTRPCLHDQIGVFPGVLLIGLEAGDLADGVAMERWGPVTKLARFIGRAHRLRFEGTVIGVKDDLRQVPEVAGLEEDAVDGTHATHVALGALDVGVERILEGSDLFGVHVVAGVGAECHAVGVFPHLDGDHTKDNKAYDEGAADDHTIPECPPPRA